MKVKPQMIQDDFMYDNYLGCPVCREEIIFPLFKNSGWGEDGSNYVSVKIDKM